MPATINFPGSKIVLATLSAIEAENYGWRNLISTLKAAKTCRAGATGR